jgi:hypothetical protein
MNTISGVGGASSAWAGASAMKAKMFAKVDSDSSGSVDKTELQGMLDKISEKTGSQLGSADDLLGKMDSDGNGSLSSDELDAGMKSLMPAPKSTVDFAQQRGGGEEGGGPPPCDGPPPAGAASSTDSSSSNGDTDPLDTNEDGTVSAQERAAGELQDLLKKLVSAADSDGDQQLSSSEIDSFQSRMQTALKQVLEAYGGSGDETASASAVSVAA